MIVKTPMIGIPEYYWRKKAWKFAKKNPNFVRLDISDFGYDCYRHIDFLNYIDNPEKDIKKSKYWEYSIKTRSGEGVCNKIEKYKQTYDRIRNNGFTASGDKNNSSIIVTDDGCRLDGSHRIAILIHLGILEVEVNVFIYESIFTKKESENIRKENLKYRKETHGL